MSKIPNDADVLNYAWKVFGRHPVEVLPRLTVREVTCPACYAPPGFPCFRRTAHAI
jgi:hypothetical protein